MSNGNENPLYKFFSLACLLLIAANSSKTKDTPDQELVSNLRDASLPKETKPKRDWLDYANFAVLVFAFFAAAAAAIESARLADLTRTAIGHSDESSDIQHEDTTKALQKAEDANEIAKAVAKQQSESTITALDLSKRAATAALQAVQTSVATERARLFVGNIALKRSFDKDPKPTIAYQILNLGKTGALLSAVSEECYIASINVGVVPIYNPKKLIVALNAILGGLVLPAPHECTLDNPITPDDYAAFLLKTKVIIFKGFVQYQDVFGTNYKKRFAFFSFGEGEKFFPIANSPSNHEETQEN